MEHGILLAGVSCLTGVKRATGPLVVCFVSQWGTYSSIPSPPSNMSDSAIKSASEDESLTIQWAPTSEEEDMAPDLEDEEGEEDEGEDEKEKADLDVIAESRWSVPAKFSKQELTIMMNAKL
ncbi:hypothetical protein PAXRUDRAFT_22315 [Paxillus rubicundulus Ve08.2h10]|uniref:Uncharacterized protein n=1 Tax=Paxillus rubicundulus Ve08.2h10 TaxID=930991 RepID=A0A0D0BKH3_9AGAM|nr:hypothetical protein PAXRUDRAFT_22315 [Paxillus rubicundulus Ve08.2h10]